MINLNKNEKQCACKGIRQCSLCENGNPTKKNDVVIDQSIFLKSSVLILSNLKSIEEFYIPEMENDQLLSREIFKRMEELQTTLNFEKNEVKFCKDNIFEGFYVVRDFFSDEDSKELLEMINKNPWLESQSGRKKQDYGPKINYKKKKVKFSENENDNKKLEFSSVDHVYNYIRQTFPEYVSKIIEPKFQEIPFLQNFNYTGLGNLFYQKSRGASIDPHIDHIWIWGNRITGLNLLSNTVITFSIDLFENNKTIEINIPVNKNDLYIMSSKSRYIWSHSIKKENIIEEERMVLTFREFEKDYEEQLFK
jgi:alkylated DNA repair protein alkB family protein 4